MFAYLSLVAAGITISLVPRLANAVGRGDRDALDRCLAVGIRFYAGASNIVLLLGLGLTPFLGRLLNVPQPLRPELQTA